MQSTLFGIYLLKAKAVFPRIEVLQSRPFPLLVLLRILLSEAGDILGELFQHLLFKLAFRLTRACLDGILAELESLRR